MITAKNYAAEAEWGLRKYAKWIKTNKELSDDHEMVLWMADTIKESQHFAVEDGGLIFNDDLKGIRGMEARLPYPCITIEYWVEPPKDNEQEFYSKNVVLAVEMPADYAYEWTGADYRGINEYVLAITYVVCSNNSTKNWVPSIGIVISPTNWNDKSLVENPSSVMTPRSIGLSGSTMSIWPAGLLEKSFDRFARQKGREDTMLGIVEDMEPQVSTVLELCEALTCSNVQISDYSPSKKSTVSQFIKNRLPQYETKCLTIDTSSKTTYSSAGKEPFDRSSPRQHLRRGHIRRLPDRNIWVNSCVVGNSEIGVIDKQYRIKHGTSS